MIKNTFRFWLMATLVLATVYLISNPTMASKLGSQTSRIWQLVISKVVKVPELVATITPAEQEELAEGSRRRGLSGNNRSRWYGPSLSHQSWRKLTQS
jgi:hypothetical protein